MTPRETTMPGTGGTPTTAIPTPLEMLDLAACLAMMEILARRNLSRCPSWQFKRRARIERVLQEVHSACAAIEQFDYDLFGGTFLTGPDVTTAQVQTMADAVRIWRELCGGQSAAREKVTSSASPDSLIAITAKLKLLMEQRQAAPLAAAA